MGVARGPVALQRLRQQLNPSLGEAQGLAAGAVAQPLQQPGGQQLQLHHVLAGPAGGAPHRAQPLLVHPADQGGRGIGHSPAPQSMTRTPFQNATRPWMAEAASLGSG
jgi:hypothetical protein